MKSNTTSEELSLKKELEQKEAELTIISTVGEAMSRQLDMTTVIKLVGDKVRDLFDAEVTEILLLSADKKTISVPYSYINGYQTIKPFQLGEGLTSKVIQGRKPLQLHTLKEQISLDAIIDEDLDGADDTESYMGVPIIFGGKVLGVVSVQSYEKHAYDENSIRLLSTLSTNMGVALENTRLFEETNRLLNETQQRNVELSILNTIQEGLVMEMEFESIINLVGDKFREALGFQDLGIRLYDKEKNTLHFLYEYEHGERLYIESGEPTPFSKYVLDSGKMLLLQRNIEEEAVKLGITGDVTIPGTDKSKSLVMVPIMLGNEAKGLILIENYEKENAFSESDVRLLTTIANSMSVALENARLFKETLRLLDDSKKRTAELSTVNSISRAIAGHLEIDKLINLVGDKVRGLFNANIVYVALLDEERKIINFPYGYGDDYPPIKLGDGLTSHIILKKKPLLINREANRKTKQLGVEIIGTPSSSYLGVPIPVGDEIIGVLSVQSTEKENVFNEDDMRLLSTVAAHVGIAINNANAYEQLNSILENLKSTQDQLIAQEKLASLGQLTAGIAHEIKNPLNFVNNFSELSSQLVDELKEELEKLKSNGSGQKFNELFEILEMLKQNSEKIKEHGTRADAIVHSMLQHSRGKVGEKQLTNINSILEEDINLVYHGMRAQDSSFNIKIEKELDKNISKINIIPQDISRVFLNILTNGFYEAHRKKIETKSDEPAVVRIKTLETKENIEIKVRDNGNGIPENIRENLFTPFFTTKPTGKGTGLGLSISYDIIAREHNGDIVYETEEGKYTEFTIRIPKN